MMADASGSTESLLKDFMKKENFDVLKLIRDTNLSGRLAITAFLSENNPCAQMPNEQHGMPLRKDTLSSDHEHLSKQQGS